MRVAIVTGVIAATLLSAPAASAKTWPTRWQEHAWIKGKSVATFNTRAITVNLGAGTWAIAASFKNTSGRAMRLVHQGSGIAVSMRPSAPGVPYRFVRASSVEPPFPAVMANGQVWRGTIRGRGIPPGRYLAAVYGRWYRTHPALFEKWRWITDHSIRIR